MDCIVTGIVTGGSGGFNRIGGIIGCTETPESRITNCTVSASGKINGGEPTIVKQVGGIVGMNAGIISNCTNHAAIYGNNCIGGVVGFNTSGGIVHTCLNTGNIIITAATDYQWIGGLAGDNFATQTYAGITYPAGQVYSCCTNTGSVNGVPANASNQFGSGSYNNPVASCPDGHAKR
jgi:hypothetical protein